MSKLLRFCSLSVDSGRHLIFVSRRLKYLKLNSPVNAFGTFSMQIPCRSSTLKNFKCDEISFNENEEHTSLLKTNRERSWHNTVLLTWNLSCLQERDSLCVFLSILESWPLYTMQKFSFSVVVMASSRITSCTFKALTRPASLASVTWIMLRKMSSARLFSGNAFLILLQRSMAQTSSRTTRLMAFLTKLLIPLPWRCISLKCINSSIIFSTWFETSLTCLTQVSTNSLLSFLLSASLMKDLMNSNSSLISSISSRASPNNEACCKRMVDNFSIHIRNLLKREDEEAEKVQWNEMLKISEAFNSLTWPEEDFQKDFNHSC